VSSAVLFRNRVGPRPTSAYRLKKHRSSEQVFTVVSESRSLIFLMPMTYVPETDTRFWYQKQVKVSGTYVMGISAD